MCPYNYMSIILESLSSCNYIYESLLTCNPLDIQSYTSWDHMIQVLHDEKGGEQAFSLAHHF